MVNVTRLKVPSSVVLGTLRGDVAEAVYSDHPCDDVDGCDIARALEEGFPFVAGYLLSGATETPHLDAVLSAHAWNARAEGRPMRGGCGHSPTDWDRWSAWFGDHSRQCKECDSFSFAPHPEDSACPNCAPCKSGMVGLSLDQIRERLSELEVGSFMGTEVVGGSWVEVEGPCGSEWIPADVVDVVRAFDRTGGGADLVGGEEVRREDLSAAAVEEVAAYYEGGPDFRTLRYVGEGYGYRLSAAGYMDCTGWTVHDTEREALEAALDEAEQNAPDEDEDEDEGES